MHIFIYFVCGGTSWIVIHNNFRNPDRDHLRIFAPASSLIRIIIPILWSGVWRLAGGSVCQVRDTLRHTSTLWGTHCNTLQHCAREEHWVGAHCNTLLGTPTNTTSDQSMLIHTNTRNTRTNKFAENTKIYTNRKYTKTHKDTHKQKHPYKHNEVHWMNHLHIFKSTQVFGKAHFHHNQHDQHNQLKKKHQSWIWGTALYWRLNDSLCWVFQVKSC